MGYRDVISVSVRAVLYVVLTVVLAATGWAAIEFTKIAIEGVNAWGDPVHRVGAWLFVLLIWDVLLLAPAFYLILLSEKHRKWVWSGHGLFGPHKERQ